MLVINMSNNYLSHNKINKVNLNFFNYKIENLKDDKEYITLNVRLPNNTITQKTGKIIHLYKTFVILDTEKYEKNNNKNDTI